MSKIQVFQLLLHYNQCIGCKTITFLSCIFCFVLDVSLATYSSINVYISSTKDSNEKKITKGISMMFIASKRRFEMNQHGFLLILILLVLWQHVKLDEKMSIPSYKDP